VESGKNSLKRHGAKIAMGIMFCILVLLAGMVFSMNSKLVHFQTRVEKRISELEKRQDSIEKNLGILKNIGPGLEGLHKHWEALREKMEVLEGAVEKFVDELSESFSREQKEKMKRAVDKLFRLWGAFGELMEEFEAEHREMKEGGEGEGNKDS